MNCWTRWPSGPPPRRDFRNSLSAEQRAELDALAQQAIWIAVADAVAETASTRICRPRARAKTGPVRSSSPAITLSAWARGTQALADIAELEQLAEQLSQSYPGATMDDVDLDALARQLGDQAAIDARPSRNWNARWSIRGSWTAGPTASGGSLPRQCAGSARLRYVMWRNSFPAVHGERDHRRAGAAGELTGATRPWQFGDTEPWNIPRTLTNAVLRQAGRGPARARRFTSPSTTSKSPRPRPAPRPWSRCWWIPRSRW